MRIRRTSVPALLLAAAALAAGCGGSEVPADEVPGGPVTLTVPEDQDIGGSSSSSSADATASDDATTSDDASTADDTAATTDDTSGGAAAPAPADSGTTAPADTAPAPADEPAAAPDTGGTGGTSEFCEQNAGAC